MKKVKKKWGKEKVIKYIILILITPLFSILAYKERGYYAVGGEVLIVPLILIIRVFIKTYKEVIKC